MATLTYYEVIYKASEGVPSKSAVFTEVTLIVDELTGHPVSGMHQILLDRQCHCRYLQTRL